MVGIVLLLVVLAYANAVDEHGSEKVGEFWRKHPTPKEQVMQADYVITPQNVTRFGYRFGGTHE